MSDTPRTDAVKAEYASATHERQFTAIGKLARELERENAGQLSELMRTWFVLKDFGFHPGRTDDKLADCVRVALLDLRQRLEAAEKDAVRYRWLREQHNLTLRSEDGSWTRQDGSRFYSTHYLAAGGKQFAPATGLDQTIDAAMQEKQ